MKGVSEIIKINQNLNNFIFHKKKKILNTLLMITTNLLFFDIDHILHIFTKITVLFYFYSVNFSFLQKIKNRYYNNKLIN